MKHLLAGICLTFSLEAVAMPFLTMDIGGTADQCRLFTTAYASTPIATVDVRVITDPIEIVKYKAKAEYDYRICVFDMGSTTALQAALKAPVYVTGYIQATKAESLKVPFPWPVAPVPNEPRVTYN